MAKTLLASKRRLYALVSDPIFIQEKASQKSQRVDVRATFIDERFVNAGKDLGDTAPTRSLHRQVLVGQDPNIRGVARRFQPANGIQNIPQ